MTSIYTLPRPQSSTGDVSLSPDTILSALVAVIDRRIDQRIDHSLVGNDAQPLQILSLWLHSLMASGQQQQRLSTISLPEPQSVLAAEHYDSDILSTNTGKKRKISDSPPNASCTSTKSQQQQDDTSIIQIQLERFSTQLCKAQNVIAEQVSVAQQLTARMDWLESIHTGMVTELEQTTQQLKIILDKTTIDDSSSSKKSAQNSLIHSQNPKSPSTCNTSTVITSTESDLAGGRRKHDGNVPTDPIDNKSLDQSVIADASTKLNKSLSTTPTLSWLTPTATIQRPIESEKLSTSSLAHDNQELTDTVLINSKPTWQSWESWKSM